MATYQIKSPKLSRFVGVAILGVMLLVYVSLFQASWHGLRLYWTPIDGKITKLYRWPRTGDCDVTFRTLGNDSERYLLASDICREHVGARIRKQAWSLDVTAETGTYRQSMVVFLALLMVVWTAIPVGVIFYIVVVLPIRDARRRRRTSSVGAATRNRS